MNAPGINTLAKRIMVRCPRIRHAEAVAMARAQWKARVNNEKKGAKK